MNNTSTNEKYQRRAKQREHLKELQRKEDVRWIMTDIRGRRFMYDTIFQRSDLLGIYPGQDSGIYRHEGFRAFAAVVCAELQKDFPDEYVLMINEHIVSMKQDRQPEEKDEEESDA